MITIGLSSKALDGKYWYDDKHTFPAIEINRFGTRLGWNQKTFDKILEQGKRYELSMHSLTGVLFYEEEQFTRTEIELIKSHITVCKKVGIKELVFHLKNERLNDKEYGQLETVVSFAKKYGVQLLLENNARDPYLVLDVLERFPQLKFNLDIGHLNLSIGRGYIDDYEDFVKRLGDRIVYLHVHNNSGRGDEHKALTDGTLNWRRVMDLVDLTKVKKIICEVKTIEDADKSRDALVKYLDEKKIKYKAYS